MRSEISTKMEFDKIRYSKVWEDHLLLEEGLNVEKGDDILSICSAGCNVLNLLLLEPNSITAIDLSPAQIALLELKVAAIRQLEYQDFIILLGHTQHQNRISLYHLLESNLSDSTKVFWQNNLSDIEQGLAFKGRLESYFIEFQRTHLRKTWPPDLVTRLLDAKDIPTQKKIFFKEIHTEQFKKLFTWYYGRKMMSEHGRDPAQFDHVQEDDTGNYFYDRFVNVCTNLPIQGNYYLEAFLTGQYRDLRNAQPYLHPDNYPKLKSLVDRVAIVKGELEDFLSATPAESFNKANLSDIFEYMSESLSNQVFTALAGNLRSKGRIAYWNLLVPRRSPKELSHKLIYLPDLSNSLWLRDRSFFYRSFNVEEIK
jgi:S-adenosylmethionine-diacylglycerol 3-amino-3-carboxypropyl transferase